MPSGPRRISIVTFVLFSTIECLAQAPGGMPPIALSGSQIFAEVARANAVRDEELQSYLSTREYTVWEPGHPPDADLLVGMQFVAPATKIFGKESEQGVGWIHKRVFHALMKAEQESAAGREKDDSALAPANYRAELVGEDECHGRACYVLALRPKRDDKYLLTGRIWIDKEDFAIAKVEGEPVKSPSFWVEHAHLVREYQRIGRFWLPMMDQTECRIRFVGEYLLRIRYFDYHVTAQE